MESFRDAESESLLVDPRNKIRVANGTPSILNVGRDPDRTSARYAETDDLKAVRSLNAGGWFVDKYKQVNAHNPEKSKFRTYLATYTHESGLTLPDEGSLTVLQKGSHDGSKSQEFNLGFFRAICANGMVAGTSLFNPFVIKHIGDKPTYLDDAVAKLLGLAPILFDKIKDFQGITLTESQALGFAHEALQVRFGDDLPLRAEDILTSVRYADSGNSLWRVLNRVQERLIKKTDLVGTFKKPELDSDKNPILGLDGRPKTITYRRAIAAVRGIDLDLKINKGVWDLADRYLKDLTPRLH